MLDSILEFITQAASSSAFIFCFCNLIIIIILVDLKPSLSIHQQSEIPLSIYTNIKQETNSKILVEKDVGSSPQEAKISHVKEREEAEVYEEAKASAMNKIEVKDNDDLSNEEEEKEEVEDGNEEEEDDELKRRVEEFIEKVNRGWKQELLSTPV